MAEARRASEARMRAAMQDAVTALDRHGDALNRNEAITVLGALVGTFALTWGREAEVVGKGFEAAKTFVVKSRKAGLGPRDGYIPPTVPQSEEDRDYYLSLLQEVMDDAEFEAFRRTLHRYGYGVVLTDVRLAKRP